MLLKEVRRVDQLDVFTGTAYTYRAIITNDYRVSMLPQDIIHFYNQRGDAERNFDMLGNDFGWSLLPFNDIATNTSYLELVHNIKSLSLKVRYNLS